MPAKRASADRLLDRLDAEAETFSRDLTREYYLNGAGLKEELSIVPIFQRHAALFSKATLDALDKAPPDDQRRPPLRAFAVEGYLENAAKSLSEAIAARETTDAATWDGKEVPYRALPVLTANEADPARRHALERLRLELTAAQNPLREERWGVLQAEARGLGHPDYAALCEDLGDLQLDALAAPLEAFLWDSEKPYRRELARRLQGIGVSPPEAERSDLAYLFRSPQFDVHFPPERLVPTLAETLRSLGIDLQRQSNVHLDVEPRPQKSPRAFCAPIVIPDEVMLVINPHGGQDDYAALFHEAGHTEHFAHVDGTLPFAARGLGDNSVTEAFAFLIEHLTYEAAWLEQRLGWRDPGEFVAFKRFFKLYMLRRYATKLLYEVELHRGGDVRSRAKRYADLLTAHLAVRYSPADYLFDVDDGFYCARYLRAWAFEAQLRRRLQTDVGDGWFLSPKAGKRLKALWSMGQRLPVRDLARHIGYSGLDFAPLFKELST
ncbi:MAG: hypothetical protein ABSG55_07615 [Dehalococcoidia bacterium]